MSKLLKLQPKPTFKLSVDIPVAGENETVNVVFTVKALKAREIRAHEKREREIELESEIIPFEGFVCDVVEGWDLDEPFSKENLLILLDNNPSVAVAVRNSYTSELFGFARKN